MGLYDYAWAVSVTGHYPCGNPYLAFWIKERELFIGCQMHYRRGMMGVEGKKGGRERERGLGVGGKLKLPGCKLCIAICY